MDSTKPKRPLGERVRAILRGLPDDPAFKRPEQPPLERGVAWWKTNGFAAPRRRKARAKH